MGAPWLPLLGLGLSFLAVILYTVATATHNWAVLEQTSFFGETSSTIGLWRSCTSSAGFKLCVSRGVDNVPAAVHFTRFAAVTSIVILASSLSVPPLVYFKKVDKKFGKISSCVIMGTGVLFALGTISFAVWQSESAPAYDFGYSIILAWLSVPVALVGGGLVLVGVIKSPIELLGQDVSLT